MKLKTSLYILLIFLSPATLSAHAAYYLAPLCIGVSFAGAFSWSVFRQPTRTPITRTEVNPVVLTPVPKKDSFSYVNPATTTAPSKEGNRVYATLEQAVAAHKKRKALNHTLPLSKTHDLALSSNIPGPRKDPVWLVAPGYKGQRPQKYHKAGSDQQEISLQLDSSLHEASTLICAANLPSPCVTFEFDDARRSFNFGQKGDLARLSLIYEELAQTHELVVFGSCRGATTVLNLLSRPETPYKKSIKALVLESPSLSLAKLAEQVGHNYLGWMPKSGSLIHTFFRTWFPSYDAQFPNCLNNLTHIPHDLPILIGHVENDKVIAWSEIQSLVQGLIDTGHKHVYLARIVDPSITHARLNSNAQFRNVLNAFLSHYKLPHEAEKAHAGTKLLEDARQEALRVAHEKEN